MKKLGLWLFIPLMVFSSLLGKETSSGMAAANAKQELAAAATDEIDVAAIKAQRMKRSGLDQIRMLRARGSHSQQLRPAQQRRLPDMGGLPFHGGRAVQGTHRLLTGAALAKSLSTISILINGVEADTIVQGDSLVYTVTFSAGDSVADISYWVDMDANGALDDTVDFMVDEIETIFDNEWDDEDPTEGVYQMTEAGDEGPNRVGNLSFLVLVSDSGGLDTASVFIQPLSVTQSVSGIVTPPVANLLIGAFPSGMMGGPDGSDGDGPDEEPWMALTDVDGAYQLFLPDTGLWDIFSIDFLGVMGGLIPDTFYAEVHVLGHETGYDFNYFEPTSRIEGFVRDNNNNPVAGVLVFVEGGMGMEMADTTDATGAYGIGVPPGMWRLHVDESVIPDYMLPPGQEVEVEDGATGVANFMLYEADATISGTVTLEGVPLPGIVIGAHGEPAGYTRAESGPDGNYMLHVSSEVLNYNLWPENQPDETVFMDKLWDIPPNASGVDINFIPATGGIFGAVMVEGTTDTLYEVGIGFRDTLGFEVHTGVDWETGEYMQYLPPGAYFVFLYHEGYYYYEAGPIVVAGDMMRHDIYLTPIAYDGAIEGAVVACDGGFALSGVEVWAWDPSIGYGETVYTDEGGFYHLDLPSGTYDVGARMEGYYEAYEQVVVPAGPPVVQDFCLERWRHIPPEIISIVDVAPDQGGWVYLTFSSGGTDEGPYIGWSIWRIPGGDYWDPGDMVFIDFLPFHGNETNTALVHTVVDSNHITGPAGDFWTHFIVSGHHPWEPFQWFDSQPGKGYSVDNIVPGVPLDLQYTAVTAGVELSWAASTDDDFQYYAVYRSEVSGSFGSAPYDAVAVNSFTDDDLTAGTAYYYAVKAVDANGNESDMSEEVTYTLLDVAAGTGIPEAYALRANYPNPFNPTTTIVFELPKAGAVSLKIYDLTGKLIRTLVNESRSAGYHRVVWDGKDGGGALVATGVYFYRIEAGKAFAKTRKMVLMK
ncbi:MAG: carboxypeptidase regulatory-like domain-containing protein [Fidelibacterota bacterium]|nr:MAG: carboxypeptidase regulatory-like domain-containing protein [Candidatus Neomarinimicrobiota bacterium]